MTKTVAILGGDSRQMALVAYLREAGFSVQSYGLPLQDALPSWREAVAAADAVVLPLPASPDGRHVHQPMMREQEAPLIAELFPLLKDDALLFGGKCSPQIKEMAEKTGRTVLDYFENEEFQLKNAELTAEGAISILMRESDCSIRNYPVLITGYGRIARALSRLLVAMGARVTVIARKRDAVLAANASGATGVLLNGTDALKHALKGQAAVINTVPHWLFDANVLKSAEQGCLMIDLASAPGGFDGDAASTLGIKVIWALSLPGKYAPRSAGEIIGETLIDMMREVEK